jgi:hypothetical protein
MRPAARQRPATVLAAATHVPPGVSLLTQAAPDELTAQFARMLFVAAPVVAVAPATAPGTQVDSALAQQATRKAHAPLLLAAKVTPRLAAEIRSLNPKAVLAEGLPPKALAAELPGIRVVAAARDLPAITAPAPLSHVAVLVNVSASASADVSVNGLVAASVAGPQAGPQARRQAGPQAGREEAGTAVGAEDAAIAATAQAAGATVVPVHGWDPRADPTAIRILARLRPASVIGIGGGFGPVSALRNRVAVAATGVQLPGGGQVLFPGHRLVALYGHPYTPGLGALGEQDLQASIARAKAMAAAYRPLSDVPVVPAFEIIATVAQGSPGPDGSYSYETPISQLQPWIKAATKAGMYIVLDLQPGRANLLTQAKLYAPLLRLPNVGLGLDPEWKLQPGQVPLQQIGHVDVSEVNSVVTWLAALTARYRLPQKLLVLHQFQVRMITDEQDLDTGDDDLAIVIHMDGQGAPAVKQDTWDAVTAAAPRGVFFGWKNFFVEDHPMLSPQQTMTKSPTPVMISYQLRMSRSSGVT